MKGAWAVLAAVGLVCVAWAASRQNHPAARVLAGAFCGLGALGAVNLLGSYTGVTLALTYAAAYCKRQFVFEYHFVIGIFFSFFFLGIG